MRKTAAILALLMFCATLPVTPAVAEVDWQARNTIKTQKPPLDVALSSDGEWTFILTEGGKLLIYDKQGDLNDTIEVDPAMDSIVADGSGGRLFLSSKKNSAVHEILLDYVAVLSYDNSPFLGNADAPVVLAVFSDFQ